MNIGTTISQLRQERGYSQEALASMLFVSKDLVSKWERGIRRPDYSMIERIAEIMNVTPDSIFEKNQFILEELSDCIPENVGISEAEFTELLNHFLSTLGKVEKDFFIRRYYLMESFMSIAERKNVRENYVRSSLSKTRKKLRMMIVRRQN